MLGHSSLGQFGIGQLTVFETVTGSLSQMLGPLGRTATATLAIGATVSASLANTTGSAAATLSLNGTLAKALADIAVVITGTSAMPATLSVVLADTTLVATGIRAPRGMVNVTLGLLTLHATLNTGRPMATLASWNLSRQTVWDLNGDPAVFAKAYFFEGNTTTPLRTYQDTMANVAHTHPVIADGYGRFPRVFLPWGTYDEKVTTAGGVVIWHDQNIPNPKVEDPIAGSPETIITYSAIRRTGDVWWKPTLGEFVEDALPCNGQTIGNGASGADKPNDVNYKKLFVFLWDNIVNKYPYVPSPAPPAPQIPPFQLFIGAQTDRNDYSLWSRGATAISDWDANKVIALPDLRGRTPWGLDDMGGAAAGRLSTANVIQPPGHQFKVASVLGENTHLMAATEMATHRHVFTGDTLVESQTHHHDIASGGLTDLGGAHSHTTGADDPPHYHRTSLPLLVGAMSVQIPGGGNAVGYFSSTNWDSGNNTTTHTHVVSSHDGHQHTLGSLTTGSPISALGSGHTHHFSEVTWYEPYQTNPDGTPIYGSDGRALSKPNVPFNTLPQVVLGTWYIKL